MSNIITFPTTQRKRQVKSLNYIELALATSLERLRLAILFEPTIHMTPELRDAYIASGELLTLINKEFSHEITRH